MMFFDFTNKKRLDCVRAALQGESLDRIEDGGTITKNLDIIQRGPPEELVGTFDRMFESKIETTYQKAREARQRLGWPDAQP